MNKTLRVASIFLVITASSALAQDFIDEAVSTPYTNTMASWGFGESDESLGSEFAPNLSDSTSSCIASAGIWGPYNSWRSWTDTANGNDTSFGICVGGWDQGYGASSTTFNTSSAINISMDYCIDCTAVEGLYFESGTHEDGAASGPTNYEVLAWIGDTAATSTFAGSFGSGSLTGGTFLNTQYMSPTGGAAVGDYNFNSHFVDLTGLNAIMDNATANTVGGKEATVHLQVYAWGGTNSTNVALWDDFQVVGGCTDCIPEPSSALLGLIAACGALIRRRR